MLLRDVLDRVCQKTKLELTECTLALAKDSTPLDMEDTVADLGNERHLVLITPKGWSLI
jgi:hypothetical protein